MRWIVMFLGVFIALPLMAQERVARMTVTGTGAVSVSPDIANIGVGVTFEAQSAAAALAGNTALMARVFETLAAAGLDGGDIRTTAISLEPRWHHPDSSTGRAPRIVGFTATNTVDLRVRDIARLGAVLDAVVRTGANRVDAIRFGISDREALEDRAREQAVADALRKAALYARAAGVALGPILEISEAGTSGAVPGPMFAYRAMEAAVPVAGGELTIRAQVNILFALGG